MASNEPRMTVRRRRDPGSFLRAAEVATRALLCHVRPGRSWAEDRVKTTGAQPTPIARTRGWMRRMSRPRPDRGHLQTRRTATTSVPTLA
jgi:hypothetical protein